MNIAFLILGIGIGFVLAAVLVVVVLFYAAHGAATDRKKDLAKRALEFESICHYWRTANGNSLRVGLALEKIVAAIPVDKNADGSAPKDIGAAR